MGVEYTNRREKRYYLHVGKTKTGKPRYYFSMKTQGQLAEEIPEGFEIYEHPANGQVFLRKKIPPIITELEKKVVENELKKLDGSRLYIADLKGEEIVIYVSNENVENLKDIFGSISPFHDTSRIENIIKSETTYAPIMKFILDDEKKRTFVVNRYCFLGSIDDWIDISSPKPLKDAAKEFINHLDKESLFELF
jgi:hypothetical protein